MLENLNPWWFYDRWEREDYHLSLWSKQKIRWVPRWIGKISVEPFSLNFVVGPRQVGKTTGIKLFIKKLIEKGVDPKSIIYVNCDLLASFKDLLETLKEVVGYKYIILDEVTSLENWWKAVKGFIDSGLFKDSVLIVSGSSSVKLKKYLETFPGRRGKGKNIIVLPLSFPEFVKVKYGKAYGIKLEKAFKEYLNLGGFPRSINKDKAFPEEFIASIDREIVRVDRDYRIARQVIYSILRKAPSPVSYSSLGKEVELSHVVIREYLSLLEDLFIVKVIFLKEGNKILFRKEKKVILRDPAIARVYSEIYDVDLERSVLYEWVVQEHLYRKFGEIYYYKNNIEIDAIADGLKVEVKIARSRRKYPRDVIVLDESSISRFLIDLFKDK